jgi:hypothetical protein
MRAATSASACIASMEGGGLESDILMPTKDGMVRTCKLIYRPIDCEKHPESMAQFSQFEPTNSKPARKVEEPRENLDADSTSVKDEPAGTRLAAAQAM